MEGNFGGDGGDGDGDSGGGRVGTLPEGSGGGLDAASCGDFSGDFSGDFFGDFFGGFSAASAADGSTSDGSTVLADSGAGNEAGAFTGEDREDGEDGGA